MALDGDNKLTKTLRKHVDTLLAPEVLCTRVRDSIVFSPHLQKNEPAACDTLHEFFCSVVHVTLLVANSSLLVHFVSYAVWKKRNKHAVGQKRKRVQKVDSALIVPRKWMWSMHSVSSGLVLQVQHTT